MKKFYRILSLVLVVCMVFTLLPATAALAVVENEAAGTNVSADAAAGAAEAENEFNISGLNDAIKENAPARADDPAAGQAAAEEVTATKIDAPDVDLKLEAGELESSAEKIGAETYAEDEIVRVIVVLEGESLLSQGYSVDQISGNVSNVANSVRTMKAQQDSVIAQINDVVMSLGIDSIDTAITAKYNYNVAVSGVAVEVPYGALEGIRELDSVEYAFVAPQYSLPETVSSSGTVDTNMYATSETFGSARTWEELGYTGAGMRIAIIDTGIDSDHPSFADAPADPSLTKDELSVIVPSLSATQLYSASAGRVLTADDLYVSEKIPYAFNYVDRNLDETHDHDAQGDHGSHVAGIAAANAIDSTDVVGVAPDAQLIIMKVFGASGGAYFDDIMAALEDCFRLDVDAVNMSLGSPAGFTDAESDAYVAYYFSMIEDTDMIVSVSAGNSYSAAYGNMWGTNVNFTWDPDNGVVSSPSTYPGATSVASVENVSYRTNYMTLGDRVIVYYDALFTFPYVMASDGATEYEYVMVPGLGEAADYEGLDVSGRIAVVQRGTIAFTEKQENAAAAGAVACIVYDNVYSADPIYMQDSGTIPSVFISRADGEALAAAAAETEDGVGTLTIMGASDVTAVESSTAGQMSDFSSWGVTPDLQLAPDVTAPGGNIYSCYTDGQYGTMSGTSMAAPHITGMSAIVIQYLDDNYDLTDAQTHTVAEALILSTAEPITESTGFLYSPRKQGSGVANVYSAVTSPAYLTVNGSTPQVSFGDDDKMTGDYTFTFELHNMSDEAQTYALDTTVLTDYVNMAYGVPLMGETSLELPAQVRYSYIENYDSLKLFDVNGDGVFDELDVQYALDAANGVVDAAIADIDGDGAFNTADAQYLLEMLQGIPAAESSDIITVPAGEDVIITVNIKLSEYAKEYMDTYYPNGIYVDGFVRFYGMSESAVDLSLPFLGFYGDWSAANIFDSTWYYADEDESIPDRYWHVLFTNFGSSYYNLGLNPYLDEEYDPAHNVLSPNGDGYQDRIDDIYLGMMRNARAVDFTWTDEDGDVVYQNRAEYVRKSYYYSAYDVNMPFIYSSYLDDIYDGYGDFEDGSVLTLSIAGYLDDGDMLADQYLDDTSIIIDTTAPELVDKELIYDATTDTRTLRLTVSDNYDIAAVIPLTLAGDPYEFIPVNAKAEGDEGETAVIDIDVSEYDASFLIAICDYGCNESYYQITFEGANNISFNKFYGYRRYSVVPSGGYLYLTTAYNGWHSFSDPAELLMHTSVYTNGETEVAAAEYIDGYVIGVDVEGTIFASKSGDWYNRTVIGTLELDGEIYPALDMAFDFTTDTLYILTDELSSGTGGHLVKMDYLTGELTDLGTISGMKYSSQPLTLACDNQGVLYTVNYNQWAKYSSMYESGVLYTIDKETAVATKVGDTGYKPENYQSMTVDHETNTLYWAAYQGYAGNSVLYEVDMSTGELTEVGAIQYNSEITALFKPYKPVHSLYPTDPVELEGLALSESSLVLAVGNQRQLISRPLPYYAIVEGEVTWTSGDETVVTVDENGLITAVGAGSTTVTASLDGQTAVCTVRVVEIDADLYVYDAGSEFVWLEMNASSPESASAVSDAQVPMGSYDDFISAAYVGGTVYTFDTAGNFYSLDAETLQGTCLGSNNDVNGSGGYMQAMAFNYADAYLYGLVLSGGYFESHYYLVRINPANGETEQIGEIDGEPMNLAIDPDGTFYSVVDVYDYTTRKSTTRVLSFRVENGEIVGWSNDVVLKDFSSYGGYSSLVYSPENDGLFWADYYGELVWIDPETGDNIILGGVGETYMGYPMNLCLMELPKEESEIHYAEIESVSMANSFMLLEGGSVTATVSVEPWNAKADVSYSIEDSSVAAVDPATGVITGLKAGVTTLTATVGERTLTATVTVIASAGNLYGNVVTDFLYGSNYWVSIPDTNPASAVGTVRGAEEFQIYAGTYYDGVIYGYGQDQQGDYNYRNYFLKVNPADGSIEVGVQIHETLRDMEFDYTTGTLYAIAEGAGLTGALAQVDTETGNVAVIGDSGVALTAMTIDDEGEIYVISKVGDLYKMDKATAEVTKIGATGVSNAGTAQSMHYDLNSGNTYWAQSDYDYTNGLYVVDLNTGAATKLGAIGSTGAELVALYTVPESAPAVPDVVDATGVNLTERAVVLVGETESLTASVLPYSVAAVAQTLTWSSSDENIATVDASGVVTGVSAGTVTITATNVNGQSASCTVTVLAEARSFYAYDETNAQWISFSGDDTTAVTVERSDEEDEAAITAAYYVDGKLYAYDADGYFYNVDADTFERGEAMEGVSETVWIERVFSYATWGYVELDFTPKVLDMSYDAETGKLYALAVTEEYDEDYDYTYIYTSAICEVNVETGELTAVFNTQDYLPSNLLVRNGTAFFVDAYVSGILCTVDLNDPEAEAVQQSLVNGYWGDSDDGRSLVEDSLTGTVYAIRDLRGGASTLMTLDLSDAYAVELGLIGEGIVANSLFIK